MSGPRNERRNLPRGVLQGRLRIPGSKSFTNRALVAAALHPSPTRLLDPLDCDDTRVLAAALTRLGVPIEIADRCWQVPGPLTARDEATEIHLDVGHAGTPARFLAALLSALPGLFVLDGSPRMRERPMGPLLDALRILGAEIEPLGAPGRLPLRIRGRQLAGGRVPIRGDISSQFLSALLLIEPLTAQHRIELDVQGTLVSAAYVDMTRETVNALATAGEGKRDLRIAGDDSAACFPIAGALLSGGLVELEGLDPLSLQPDSVFRDWAGKAGGLLTWQDGAEGKTLRVDGRPLRVADSGFININALTVDVDAAPDTALALVALLAFANGTSVLHGIERLREKESDRLAAAIDLVTRAGGKAQTESEPGSPPRLILDGPAGSPRGADFKAWGDHRVAMAAAVLALGLPGGSTIDNPEVASKSWPGFFEVWQDLVVAGKR